MSKRSFVMFAGSLWMFLSSYCRHSFGTTTFSSVLSSVWPQLWLSASGITSYCVPQRRTVGLPVSNLWMSGENSNPVDYKLYTLYVLIQHIFQLGEVDCWELECPAIDNSMGEVACCSSMNGATGAHIPEALCSPNSSTPCPQAAHHTAPDCQVSFLSHLQNISTNHIFIIHNCILLH